MMVEKISLKFVFVVFILLAFQSFSFAEDPPPGQEAGPQADRFKSSGEQAKERLEEKKAKPPEIKIEEEKEAPPPEQVVSFILKEVKVSGATVFKPEDFLPAYQSYLDKEVTLDDIKVIIEKIRAFYKERGYLTTAVFLPEQEIKEGKIELRALEGKMGELAVEGNKWFSSPLIKKYFHIKKNEILNFKSLHKDLLRLKQNPDLEVKIVVSDGKEPGASDLTLKAKEQFPWHSGISFDNQGTRLTGKYRESFYIRSTNATGNNDSLFVSSLLSSLSFGQSLSYTLPLGTSGTKLGLDAAYFKMRLGKEFKSLEITGKTQIYTLRLTRELFLSYYFTADIETGMDIKAIMKRTDGIKTADDQLRIPFFGFNFMKIDSFGGKTNFSPKFSFGTSNFWGASTRSHPSASRRGSGGFFFKYGHSIRRAQRMPFDSYLLVRSQFQAASHTLPSSEQFQLGGANSIRGYPEGDYLADIGGSANFDWVLPNFLIPKSWKLANYDTNLRHQIEPVVFVDIGGGKLKKVISGERPDKILVGLGGGLRLRFSNKFYLRLDWAQRVGDRQTGGSGPSTFHLTFSSEL